MLRVVDVRRNASSFWCKLIVLPSYTPNIILLSIFIPRVCILQTHTFALFRDTHCEVWFVFLFSWSSVLVWVVLVVLFVYCCFVCILFLFCFNFYQGFFEALTHQVSGINYMVGPCLLMILKACTESLLSYSKIKICIWT